LDADEDGAGRPEASGPADDPGGDPAGDPADGPDGPDGPDGSVGSDDDPAGDTAGEADPEEPLVGEPAPGEAASGRSAGLRLPIGPGDAGGRNGTSRVWVVPSESSFEPAVIAANVGTDAKPTRSATMST
jgi:hypothetical protein